MFASDNFYHSKDSIFISLWHDGMFTPFSSRKRKINLSASKKVVGKYVTSHQEMESIEL